MNPRLLKLVNKLIRTYDINGDGFLNADETELMLSQLTKSEFDDNSSQSLLPLVDTNRDGKVCRNDLYNFLSTFDPRK
ncbi:MAG: EF-hand domain-containing protein [Actinobacteria bacterium]|nr:EF-hand domain-containing protein [Actinomycetota bacterium]